MIHSLPGLFTFIVATFAVLATPGITVSALTGTTLSHGPKAGFALEFGASLARASMVLVLALGLQAVSDLMLIVFDWVKLAGAAYLIWLGIKTIRHPPHISTSTAVELNTNHQILKGFIVLWGNPKALIFFGAFVPQFIDPTTSLLPQILTVGVIWVAVGLFTDSCYIALSAKARSLFKGAFAQKLGYISGAILIGAGVWLAFQQKA